MKKIKKFLKHKITLYTIGFSILGAILMVIALVLSDRYDLMGWTNATTFSALSLFALIWLTFANNKGVFDMLTFGLKAFFNGFKKNYEKLDYLEYKMQKEEVGIEVYIGLIISCILYAIPAIILTILVLKS